MPPKKPDPLRDDADVIMSNDGEAGDMMDIDSPAAGVNVPTSSKARGEQKAREGGDVLDTDTPFTRDMASVRKAEDQQQKKKKETPASRQGARRSTATGPQKEDEPGDPRYPATFLTVESNEQKTAAYLGYNDVQHLRILIMSWPVLLAYAAFDQIGLYMSRKGAFTLLHDSESMFDGVKDPIKKWAITPEDTKAQVTHKRSRYLAFILLRLEGYFRYMARVSGADNEKMQLSTALKFRGNNPQIFVPVVTFLPSPANPAVPMVRFPTLGPYLGEKRLEALNRCWLLLRYFRYCRQSHEDVWASRFSQDNINLSIRVNISHVPHWMKKRDDAVPAALDKTADVAAADALPPVEYQVLWDQNAHFDGKEELDDALNRARAANVRLPSTLQSLQTDPRLIGSAAAFKDSIRRQFNCEKIPMNIRTLELHYVYAGTPEKPRMVKNILVDAWDETKSTLAREHNTDFVVHVTFEAVDDLSESIYESFEPPPAIAAYFDTASGDVLSHTDELAATASAAFPPDNTSQASQAEAPPIVKAPENLPAFLDLVFSQSGGAGEVGSPPDPGKKYPRAQDKKHLLAWYDGHDVATPEGKRAWQRNVMEKLSMNGRAATVKVNKLPRSLTAEQAEAITEARALGEQIAMSREDEQQTEAVDEERYYTMQTAFSGTPGQAGPPVDLCLQLLDCVLQPSGRYRSSLLKNVKVTDRDFFHFQVSGAVGVILKLYGKIDAEKLLRATKALDHPRAAAIRQAAAQLNSLKIHGAIMADDVGFGKTIQLLLAAFLHTLLTDEYSDGKVLYRPMLLVTPPSLINQWLAEIRDHWPYFAPIISYEDHNFKEAMSLDALSHSAMAELPSMETTPQALRYVWDTSSRAAGRVIIVTSYETHKNRTGVRTVQEIPGVRYKKPRFRKDGSEIWKKRPRKVVHWETAHEGRYSLIMCDECQKIKNYSSGLWSVLYRHSIRKTILATATPIFNTVKDLLAMLALLWPMAETELTMYVARNPAAGAWLAEIVEAKENVLDIVDDLEPMNPLRLAALNPKALQGSVTRKVDNVHRIVSRRFKPVLELSMIRRSAGSVLPVSVGNSVPLRDLFKKKIRKTAVIERRLDEEMEYQMFHREAAKEYVNAIPSEQNAALPSKPVSIQAAEAFRQRVQPMRKLGMANFATKLARLNAIMEHSQGNTHVKTLSSWREKGFEAEFIHELTRGKGEGKAKTAAELLDFLVDGSPVCRLAFQELLTVHAIDPVDEARYKGHQKLLIGEYFPASAYYLQCVLRAALIDARIMHAGMSNRAKAELVNLFNDPNSTVQVVIMTFDVGAVGLNLHGACNRALITTPARSIAQEDQFLGRASRVTSKYPLTVVRKETPNSHDQVRSARQADKATVQLAANAHDPAIKGLTVQLLNELQPEVNECHASQIGQELLAEVAEARKTRMVAFAMQKKEADKLKAESRNVKNAAKETQGLATTFSLELPLGAKRQRRPPVRYDPFDYEVTAALHQPGDDDSGSEDDDDDDKADKDFRAEEDDDPRPSDDEDGEHDLEGPRPNNRRFVDQQKRADDLDAEEDFLMFENAEELAEFVSENQPDDETRHRLALLRLPRDKLWCEDDLQSEFYLRVGLLLLYNLIQGKSQLALGKSVHIRYLSFPADVIKSMNATNRLTKARMKAVRKRLGT